MAVVLSVVSSFESDDNLYLSQLNALLFDLTGLDHFKDEWSYDYLKSTVKIETEEMGCRFFIDFSALPSIPKMELMCFWMQLLLDKRTAYSALDRNKQATLWLCKSWDLISKKFGVRSISEIPSEVTIYHPEENKKGSNDELLELYSQSKETPPDLSISYIKGNERIENTYHSPRVTAVGSILNEIIKAKEQFKPLDKRNIIYINDLYDEEQIRFKDKQSRSDIMINFYNFPEWYRDVARGHALDKAQHGELGPQTLRSYVGVLSHFPRFMEQNFQPPYPEKINSLVLEDEFMAWGNNKDLKGKNWFTNSIAALDFAHKRYPSVWPAITISPRVHRKIKGSHYKAGLGRIGHNQEGAGRAIPVKILEEIARHIHELSSPTPTIFALVHGTGMRAEDAHAILFDCLRDDPHDPAFKILTFWQNKVSKWNDKPLQKTDPLHQQLITTIEEQRKRIIEEYGHPTKYLFPTLTGSSESYVKPTTSLQKIKQICIEYNIQDETGKIYNFTWHPMRHAKGTSMAKAGMDILQIMLELGHQSPDMATVYVNNRYQLKKQALIEKGGGKFITIKGEIDESIATLLVKKEELKATRVCGGACSMPKQIGDWCAHANACLTCKHFRADSKDIEYFKSEKAHLIELIEEQSNEAKELAESGRTRLAEITKAREAKNKEIVNNISAIINTIENVGTFAGNESKFQKERLMNE